MANKFDDLNDAFNVAGDIVPAATEKTEVIPKQEKPERPIVDDVRKDYEYTEETCIQSSKRVRKQSMEFLS